MNPYLQQRLMEARQRAQSLSLRIPLPMSVYLLRRAGGEAYLAAFVGIGRVEDMWMLSPSFIAEKLETYEASESAP